MTVRPLGQDDIEAVWRLNQLTFGYRSDEPPTELVGMHGIDGPDGRLLAGARIRCYDQMWGGRPVAMGGLAAVAVHPDGRGRGLASELMRALLHVMRDQGQPVSALYPTGVGVYRPLGWEVVGTLDDTRFETRDLKLSGGAGVTTRAAGPADVAGIARLYTELGESVSGLLVREGVEFPRGAEAVLDHDVVTVAEDESGLVGYVSYSRGSGYQDSQLRVWECLARSRAARAALLTSLSSWSTVATSVLFRGPTDDLRLVLTTVPPPQTSQPWMLRIVDAPAAMAARGFPAGRSAEAEFLLVDPDIPQHSRPWRLVLAGGRAELEPAAGDLPSLHVRGLALLYAGAADTAGLRRAGLLDGAVPGLDAAFAGRPPQILDYF